MQLSLISIWLYTTHPTPPRSKNWNFVTLQEFRFKLIRNSDELSKFRLWTLRTVFFLIQIRTEKLANQRHKLISPCTWIHQLLARALQSVATMRLKGNNVSGSLFSIFFQSRPFLREGVLGSKSLFRNRIKNRNSGIWPEFWFRLIKTDMVNQYSALTFIENENLVMAPLRLL